MSVVDNPRVDELLREGRVEEALREPIKRRRTDDRLGDFLRGGASADRAESGLYASLTVGDFLYDYVRIDPKVVNGIDFASTEDLSSVFSFARFAEREAERTGAALDGSISRLQGYVAEQFVALHLQAQGHDVTFPETSNQAGFDLLIDGEPAQVKCLESAQALRDHLDRYPDIPVYANVELAPYFEGDARVTIDPELSVSEVRAATEDTLEAGRDLGDFEIPWISLAVSGAVALRDFVKGDTDLQGAVTNMTSSTAGRIACGKLGEVTVSVIGGLLFGPAGVIIGSGVGAVGGASVGARVARTARGILTASYEDELNRRCVVLAHAAAQEVPGKLVAWHAKRQRLRDALNAGGNSRLLGDHLIARLDDDIRYFENKRDEFEAIADVRYTTGDPLADANRLLVLLGKVAVNGRWIRAPLEGLFEAMWELTWQRRRYRLA